MDEPSAMILRLVLAGTIGTGVMLGAGYLSWMRSDLVGVRFWGPLFGGLILASVAYWVIFLRFLVG